MKHQSSLVGILLMVAAVIFFALKDAFAKMSGGNYSPVMIIWAQFAFMSALYLPILVTRYGWRILIPQPLGWQILRGLSITAAMGLFYWSILLIPLADATAMAFTAPLIVTALSPWMLNEKVGIRRWSMVVVGFAGALILLRPAFTGDGLGYIIAFSTGLLLGFFYALNRKLANAAPPLASIAYSAYIGLFALIPLVPFHWSPPRSEDSWLIFGFVAVAAVGQTLLISAFRHGQASLVAPFHFVQIVAATLFGLIFFSQFPDGLTWLGVTVVVSSGIYIAVREARAPAVSSNS